MAMDIVRLKDELLFEYGLHTQRLFPWDVVNAPFESSWAVADPRTRSKLHSHHEQEIFVAVRGEAVLEIDGEQAPFKAGDVAYFKPGKEHRLLNDGDDEFMFYSIWWDRAMGEKYMERAVAEGHQ